MKKNLIESTLRCVCVPESGGFVCAGCTITTRLRRAEIVLLTDGSTVQRWTNAAEIGAELVVRYIDTGSATIAGCRQTVVSQAAESSGETNCALTSEMNKDILNARDRFLV